MDGKWRAIRGALRHERLDMSTLRILDLGAGMGEDCHKLRQLGCRPERILAIDLLDDLARSARQAYPWLASIQAGGWELPLAGASVDLVMQSTMLSSVIDSGRRARIYAEIRRVVRPGGLFVSYDLRYPSPLNRDVRPVPLQELKRAFRGWRVIAGSVTGIPPLLRALAIWSRRACDMVETIPLLRTHLLVRARKPLNAGEIPAAS